MQNPVRDRLESAALRLDDFLKSSVAQSLGPHERTVLSAVNDIAQAIELLIDRRPEAAQTARGTLSRAPFSCCSGVAEFARVSEASALFPCGSCTGPAQAKTW